MASSWVISLLGQGQGWIQETSLKAGFREISRGGAFAVLSQGFGGGAHRGRCVVFISSARGLSGALWAHM